VPVAAARPAPTDVDAVRARRSAQWQAHHARPEAEVTTGELDAYFARLVRRNRSLLAGYARDVAVVAGDRTWTVRVRPEPDGRTVVDGPPSPGPVYEFRMASRVLRAIVDGDATWEEALLSLRISLRRSPDLFDVTLMGLLRYGETPVVTRQLVLDSTASGETIERDGVRMQRFCPHAGEDLTHATVTGGRIECPRHHWAWDLATGECVQGGTLPLSVTPLAEPAVSSG
jgi:UDP-MurNAc hydroxylase